MNSAENNFKESEANTNDMEEEDWKTVTKTNRAKKKSDQKPNSPNKTVELGSNPNSKIDLDINKDNVQKVKTLVDRKIKSLIIIRGISGSGKSTLARQIKFNGIIISADEYFIDPKGNYIFDPFKLNDAHQFCRKKAEESLENGVYPIIIDNTNLKIWEFQSYITLAVKHDYHVELMEPNTPWRYKARILSEKNVHGVCYNKIKISLNEFDKNVNLLGLVEQAKRDLNQKNNVCSIKKKKPGSFLPNYEDFFKNDWTLGSSESLPTTTSNALSVNSIEKFELCEKKHNKPLKENFDSEPNSNSALSKSLSSSTHSKTTEIHAEMKSFGDKLIEENSIDDDLNIFYKMELTESQEMLSQMFPNIKKDIIMDFLLKYQNNVDMVTNILLDSINLDEESDNNEDKSLCIKTKENNEPVERERVQSKATCAKRSPLTLKDLCIVVLNKLDIEMEKHLNLKTNESLVKEIIDFNLDESEDGSFMKRAESSNDRLTEKETLSDESLQEIEDEKKSKLNESVDIDDEQDHDPILRISLNKRFLSSLVQLFGDDDDQVYLMNDCLDIDLSLNQAHRLYKCWKNTTRANNTQKNLDEQIKNDMRYCFELFKDDNTSLKTEESFSKFGFQQQNDQQNCYSLRQIMAEQMAEEHESHIFSQSTSKNNSENLLLLNKSKMRPNYSSFPNTNNLHNSKNAKNMANLLKLKYLQDKYENIVDKKSLEDILKNFKFNLTDACNHINDYFELSESELKEPGKLMKMKPLEKTESNVNNLLTNPTLSSATTSNNKLVKQLSPKPVKFDLLKGYQEDTELVDGALSREVAEKYGKLRKELFEKASVAYKRGWGAVAQYYAEMAHQQTINLQDANQKASYQIFMNNNPDLINSNTLDLHGLHSKEALTAFKQLLKQRKEELIKNGNRKQKTYIFVITGCGNHSSSKPVIRPTIINYLNQKHISYKEPRLGLLKVQLV